MRELCCRPLPGLRVAAGNERISYDRSPRMGLEKVTLSWAPMEGISKYRIAVRRKLGRLDPNETETGGNGTVADEATCHTCIYGP